MESDGDADKCIYTAEVKTSLYILDKKGIFSKCP
jgi:hypothetical protein